MALVDPQQILGALQSLVPADRIKVDLSLDRDWLLQLLWQQNIELQGLMPWSSNYTFLTSLAVPDDEAVMLAIYKPCRGERPLWDFPDGMLCQREFATYLISEILGWPRIPPTVLRANGPHGSGTLQLFIEADYDIHYFNLKDKRDLAEEFRKIALFDHVVNNADRKGGHCLQDDQGRIWAIDHGLTFHTDYKLRTVIWEYCNEPIPEPLFKDLERLRGFLDQPTLCLILKQLLTTAELHALRERVDILLVKGHLPRLHYGRNVPYPPI
jgi:uncharacterized repeat protein (TIGR03843 family)